MDGFDGYDGGDADFDGGAFDGDSGSDGDGGGSDHGFGLGHFGHALACMGFAGAVDDECCGRRVKLPGIACGDRTIQVLVWPHGHYDVPGLVRELAKALGMHNLAPHKADMVETPEVHKELKDTTPFDGRSHNTPMPSGWYPEATGFTEMFRQYWQLPRRKWWLGALEFDPNDPVHVQVTGATWFYNEVGDFETRIAFRVNSRAVLRGGTWHDDKKLVRLHRCAALALADRFMEKLKVVPPLPSAVEQRRIMAKRENAEKSEKVNVGRSAGDNRGTLPMPPESSGPDPMQFDFSC